jgi:phosphoglycerol transferase MdoB-like AlkP superfamily enzyme
VVVLCAKAATLALRAFDGGGRGLLSAWSPAVLIYQDLWLLLAFAALEAALAGVAARWPRAGAAARAAVSVGYGMACVWVAVNVPVARLFSTPATFSFLCATGSALGDSAAATLTVANVGVPLALAALAALLAHVRWPVPARRAHVAAIAAALALLALFGSASAARVPTLGLHRNAVVTLLATTAAHYAQPRERRRRALPSQPACAPSEGASADLRDLRGAAAGRNVVWLILESTAARFMSTYGAERDATPNLTALAGDAVVFDAAYAAYPESIKGLFSMLCARQPLPRRQAAQHAQGRTPCDPLPALMARAGYRTALFHSGRFAYLGMQDVIRDRGFQRMEDGASIGGAFASSFGVDEPSTVRRILAQVDRLRPDERFFAVYMPIAGHHPYHAPGAGPRPFPERHPADAYANDLFAGDAAFGLLRDGLRRRGLDQRTLYVVVGDHGEAFFEHEGNFAHSLFVYEENVRVPFFVAAPGLLHGQRRAPQLASLIDVAPTVLDLVGLPPAEEHDGRTLLSPGPRLVVAYTDQGVWRSAVRDGRWKLIDEPDSGRAQLYDLGADPTERIDLAPREPARVQRYRACLAATIY